MVACGELDHSDSYLVPFVCCPSFDQFVRTKRDKSRVDLGGWGRWGQWGARVARPGNGRDRARRDQAGRDRVARRAVPRRVARLAAPETGVGGGGAAPGG